MKCRLMQLSVHLNERNGAKIRKHKRQKSEIAGRFQLHPLSAIKPAFCFEIPTRWRYQARQIRSLLHSKELSETTLQHFNPNQFSFPIFNRILYQLSSGANLSSHVAWFPD